MRSLLRGYQRRQRSLYESNQWLANAIGAMFSSSHNDFPGWGMPWPWNRRQEEERSRREAEKSRQFLEQIKEEERQKRQQHTQTDDTEV